MIRVLALSMALVGAAEAQEVFPCEDYRSSAQAIAEPWEANSRVFANGQVRLAVIDTIEPAAAAWHLLILSPPYDEVGGRQCVVVSTADGIGFGGLDLSGMQADYDPALGLTFAIPARRWDAALGDAVPAVLSVTLNQSTGAIAARLE